MRWQHLPRLFREIQRGKKSRLGDIAILKADMLGAGATPAIAPLLDSVVGYYPPIDLDRLHSMPEGSFGYEYARHMRANGLQPLEVSPELDAIARRNVFALRYAVTHDIFHVLLGFDTSYAGEMGVLAFAVAQKYSRSQRLGLWIATWLYPLLAPRQWRQICASKRQGLEFGQQAKFLLGYRFEEQWERSLDEVRAELDLPPRP